MAVSVDTRRMGNRVLSINRANLTATVQAGITGSRLEELLGEGGGFTCGHEPDSMEFSTLGGWIATNASGMKKNRYGNIEDIGRERDDGDAGGRRGACGARRPRESMGIQPGRWLFGSEGNLGLITRAIVTSSRAARA